MKKKSNIYSVLAEENEEASSSASSVAEINGGVGEPVDEVQQPAAENAVEKKVLRMPLVWIDLEMTGLDLEKDRILEIACIITDGRLNKMIEGPNLVVHQPDEALEAMSEWCQTHHHASGLVERVKNSKVTEDEAEMEVLRFVEKYTIAEKAQLAGNSVYNDLNFLRKYMPKLAAHFSHVIVDVSSIRALCYRWFPREQENAPCKKNNHRALEDIKESIDELKYLRKAIFKDTRKLT